MTTPQDDGPSDPVSNIDMIANGLHELYLGLLSSGFSDVQAMYLTKGYMQATVFHA